MGILFISFIIKGNIGNIANPIHRTNKNKNLYTFSYKRMSEQIFTSSCSAIGLYKLNIIACPIPSSAKDSNVKTFENNPLTPK